MAKTKLSISLIKEGIPINRVLKPDILSLTLANGLILYYKNNQPASPKWVNSFLRGEYVGLESLQGKSVSAVILYQIDVGENVHRIFAVCFGFGRSLLESKVVEKRFGLLATLNSVDADKLRSIDINSMEAVPLNNRIQSSALAEIRNFNIDVDRDLLKSVSGKASEGELSGTISGADSLSVSTDKSYDELEEFLTHCYHLYKSNHYRDAGFEEVNQIQEIKDKTLIKRLDQLLLEEFNSANTTRIWTSIPEIIDYYSLESFKLKTDNIYDDLSIEIIKDEYGNDLSLNDIKKKKVTCLNAEETPVRNWSVYRCLYADINYEGHQYLLNDGKWYEVDQDYVHKVQQYYEDATLSDIPMLDYAWKEEKDYNVAVCNEYPDRYCLMDRRTVYQCGNPIEFCDIYSRDKQFIHVKKYNGSSVLSHLFFQGYVSAENFFDLAYRQNANRLLGENFQVPETDNISALEYEVIFAIAKDNLEEGERPDIPFFSKVSFRSVSSRLKHYGFKVSIKGINRTYRDNNNDEGGNEE